MRKYFITGLLVLVPLGITAWVLSFVINAMDQSLLLLPPGNRRACTIFPAWARS